MVSLWCSKELPWGMNVRRTDAFQVVPSMWLDGLAITTRTCWSEQTAYPDRSSRYANRTFYHVRFEKASDKDSANWT